MRRSVLLSLLLLIFFLPSWAQMSMQVLVDSLREKGNFPGLSVAIVYKDGSAAAFVSGYNDKEKGTRLKASDYLMQGSVGKTYASAIALKLVKEGRISLDEKVSHYLNNYDWFARVPNAAAITVRMLLNHTSGVMRYEFKDAFLKDLSADPDKVWTPTDLLAYVLDEKPGFAAGEDWEYSDTNYILLGMIIKKVTGRRYYDLVSEQLIEPFSLTNTRPSDGRWLPGLSQGYAGDANEFGGKDRVIGDDGLFIVNPQFEWTGGGIHSTTLDLARWGKLLYENKVVDTSLLLSSAVTAKLGRDTKYALGVIIRNTPLGPAYGHSGFFPGYMTELLYFPSSGICVAVQCNSSDFTKLKLSLLRCAMEIGGLVIQDSKVKTQN